MQPIDQMQQISDPIFVINSSAPIRICDNGGWTDTWFSEYGRVLNIGVSPRVEVQISAYARKARMAQIRIHALNYGDWYCMQKGTHWGKHPLLEAAIEFMQLSDEYDLDISVFSEAPGGASTGTSAAVVVALIGALDQLRGGEMGMRETARCAHRVETELLGLQSGIQDQICSAFGGINYIEMNAYPEAEVEQLKVLERTLWMLESRLILIYLGQSHSSSKVHEMVISQLKNAGPECKQLQDLRLTAALAREAICAGNLEEFGQSLICNTEAQRNLHPGLVNPLANQIIEVARRTGASGWKVNGAGGEGGSLTILSGIDLCEKQAMIAEIKRLNPRIINLPIQISSEGLRVWRASP